MSEVFFDESVVLLDLEGRSKEEVLEQMADNMEEKGLVKDTFKSAIIAREVEYATGLPTSFVSVAIPHTDIEHVSKKAVSVAILKEAVPFGIMGDPEETTDVKIVFMLAMDEADSQLGLLTKLMQVFQDEDTLKFLVNEKDKVKLVELLSNKLGFTLEGGVK